MQRLKVSAACPSCGAPFELLEGSNVARCPFCDLPLLFQSEKKILRYYLEPKVTRRSVPFLVDRHRKENRQSLPKRIGQIRLFYLPFWRFTAQAFYSIIGQPSFSSLPAAPDEEQKTEEIQAKDWDVNFSAHRSNDLGISTLGMRPDWLKLKIMTEGTPPGKQAEILSLEIESKVAKARALKSLGFYLDRKKSPEDQLVTGLLEERLSLIYFPVWVASFVASDGKQFQVIDAIAKRTLRGGTGDFELRMSRTEDVEKFGPLGIVPHRCPNCGWDLPVVPFHVVFPCQNCERIWEIHQGSYRRTKAETAKVKEQPAIGRSSSLGYYPFWVFEVRFKQGRNSSVKDVYQLLPSEIGLFGVKDESRPFLFYVPAFEMRNLHKIPHIGLAFVRTQPDLEIETVKKRELKGVFLSEDDAKKMVHLLWLTLISRKANLELRDWKNPSFEKGRILWCPCYDEGPFLRDALIGYSFQRVG